MKYVRSALGSTMIVLGAALPACTFGGRSSPPSDLRAWGTQQDSLSMAHARLSALVRTVDRVGRKTATLPATLDAIRSEPGVVLVDPWGRSFVYSVSERDFAIRSAGRDGIVETEDDVEATGHLGRAMPCELRDERQTTRFERVAPPCDAASVEVLYPLCPVLEQADRIEREIPQTQKDSVMVVGRRLVRVARAIDGYGREIGVLPQTLRGPVIWGRTESGELPDLWGRNVRYQPDKDQFELRSPGPDRRYDTEDDVVVSARLGTSIPCRFRAHGGVEQCAELPPACPSAAN